MKFPALLLTLVATVSSGAESAAPAQSPAAKTESPVAVQAANVGLTPFVVVGSSKKPDFKPDAMDLKMDLAASLGGAAKPSLALSIEPSLPTLPGMKPAAPAAESTAPVAEKASKMVVVADVKTPAAKQLQSSQRPTAPVVALASVSEIETKKPGAETSHPK